MSTYKPQLFCRRCCFNCKHHLDFISSGPKTGTVVCSIFAEKEYHTSDGKTYIGVDYSKRKRADHIPCKHLEIDTNVPKGFSWPFLNRVQPQMLNLFK